MINEKLETRIDRIVEEFDVELTEIVNENSRMKKEYIKMLFQNLENSSDESIRREIYKQQLAIAPFYTFVAPAMFGSLAALSYYLLSFNGEQELGIGGTIASAFGIVHLLKGIGMAYNSTNYLLKQKNK